MTAKSRAPWESDVNFPSAESSTILLADADVDADTEMKAFVGLHARMHACMHLGQELLPPPPDRELKMHVMCEHFPGTKECHASWD